MAVVAGNEGQVAADKIAAIPFEIFSLLPPESWRPTASPEVLRLRAQLLSRVRDFFARRGLLEVETPILSAAGSTDLHLHSYTTVSAAPDENRRPGYLHTSPEFAMKRLLAAGSGSIYQICKVFRDHEIGPLHNPEFTMVEWYRVGYSYHQLMDEVSAFLSTVLDGFRTLGATEKLTYREAFLRYCGTDPHSATAEEMIELASAHDITVIGLSNDDVDGWRDLLLTRLVEPHLGHGRLTFVHDYPASAAALARVRQSEPPVAERFEVYLDGVELANGFQELTSAIEQRQRFEQDNRVREQCGMRAVTIDGRLIAALRHGLPECSGVALGFDRLVMLAAGADSIDKVLPFPIDRA